MAVTRDSRCDKKAIAGVGACRFQIELSNLSAPFFKTGKDIQIS
jgi:hypothetical protein